MAIMRVLQDRLSSFTYELSDSKNFEEKELHSYKDLVEHVKSENLRLLMENTEGQVTITKVDRALYAKAYYGQSFFLPQNIDTDWNKELAAFKTKKPIPFEVSKPHVKEEAKELEIVETESSSSPTIIPTVEVEEKSEISVPTEDAPLNPFESENDFEEKTLPLSTPSLNLSSLIEKYDQDEITEPVVEKSKITPFPPAAAKNFSDFINNFKSQGLDQLSQFVKTKNQEMYDEIRQLDHRANIREEVTSNLNKQYSIEKQNIHTECQDELDKQMQAEKLRHEQAIQKIRSDIENSQSEKITKLKNQFILTKENEISRRFKLETEELAAILKTKKAEAALQQEQLKSELQAFLDKAVKEAQMSQQTLDSKLSELNVTIPEEKYEEVEHGVVERQRTQEVSQIEAYN
ncbi:hypothetical protein [Lactococcus lactis]|uniref:hypothetical protein n=1 Tax=Lactococcus lactis TaxID=1358 RepID=UPI000C7CD1C9|nr:hypothetical protein [Lactococcus lactis]